MKTAILVLRGGVWSKTCFISIADTLHAIATFRKNAEDVRFIYGEVDNTPAVESVKYSIPMFAEDGSIYPHSAVAILEAILEASIVASKTTC
jgi:hypothetical protein